MRRNRSEPILFDPEPERTLHHRRAQQRLAQQSATMAGTEGGGGPRVDPEMEARIEARVQERLAQRLLEQEQQIANRSLRDQTSASMSYDYPGSIVFPNTEGANFELKPQFIHLVSQHQFGGSSLEDPHAHLERFIRNCNTYRSATVSADTIRMTLFPFSLRDAADEWLHSQPQGSIRTWEDLAEKFTTKFVPRDLLRKMKSEITNFTQLETENLHEAWERFKKMLRKCPQHNLNQAEQVSKFYDGLLYSAKSNLDAAANGEFDALLPQAGKELIDKMAARAINSNSDRQNRRSVFEVKAVNQLMASNKQMAKKMAAMQKQMQEAKLMRVSDSDCVTCGSPHCGDICVETLNDEEVKVLGQFRNDPHSNTYNPGWRNHPNFSWRDRDQGNNNNGQGGNNYKKSYPNQRFQGQGFRQQQPTQEQGSGSSGGKKSLE